MNHRENNPTKLPGNWDTEVEYEFDPLKKDEEIKAYDDLAADLMFGTIFLKCERIHDKWNWAILTQFFVFMLVLKIVKMHMPSANFQISFSISPIVCFGSS